MSTAQTETSSATTTVPTIRYCHTQKYSFPSTREYTTYELAHLKIFCLLNSPEEKKLAKLYDRVGLSEMSTPIAKSIIKMIAKKYLVKSKSLFRHFNIKKRLKSKFKSPFKVTPLPQTVNQLSSQPNFSSSVVQESDNNFAEYDSKTE